jgi:hypothetical protein
MENTSIVWIPGWMHKIQCHNVHGYSKSGPSVRCGFLYCQCNFGSEQNPYVCGLYKLSVNHNHSSCSRWWNDYKVHVAVTVFQQACTAGSQRKTYMCCCKRRGVSAVMNIPRTGFVPGEAILISAEIGNFSSKAISCVKAELVQVMKTTMLCCTKHNNNWSIHRCFYK